MGTKPLYNSDHFGSNLRVNFFPTILREGEITDSKNITSTTIETLINAVEKNFSLTNEIV